MKKLLILGILFLTGTTLNINAQTKKSEIANPSDFQKIEAVRKVADCRNTLKICGEETLVALDLAGFGGPDYIKYKTETFEFKNGVGVYLLTITGIEEMFSRGERIRLSFTKSGGNYRFVNAGSQYLCSVGRTSGTWQKTCSPDAAAGRKETSLNEVRNGDNFRFITVNGRAVGELMKPCYDSLETCGQLKLDFYGYERLAIELESDLISQETFTYTDEKTNKKTGVYLITETGLKDDSVSGERVRIEFEREKNAWIVRQGGNQFQCARGKNAGTWTMELCP